MRTFRHSMTTRIFSILLVVCMVAELIFVSAITYAAGTDKVPVSIKLTPETQSEDGSRTAKLEVSLSETAAAMIEISLTEEEISSLSLSEISVVDEAELVMTLADVDTKEIYFQKKSSVRAVMDARTGGRTEFRLDEPLRDSEEKELVLTWQLKNAGTTAVHLTANQKQAIVHSFNGMEDSGINVIYTLSYGNSSCLTVLYVLLCAGLLLFAALCYWMLIVRRMRVEKFFLPMALFLGLILQCVITVGGVPDEPGHLDTAYKYSNKLLFVEDTGDPDTIYKRRCDVEMSDMLANGLESNSYYQLMTDTFHRAEDTELMEVSYADSTNLASWIVYIPSALGLSAGRLLGLSPMFTFQIARIFNLICFVFLVWAGIRMIPFGKNIFAMTAVLPIALQQGASVSYDAVVNGVLLLFTAFCFHMKRKEKKEKREIIFAGIFSVFIAVVKGGAYLPLLLLLIPAFVKGEILKKQNRKKLFLYTGIILCAAVLLTGVALFKFMPVLRTFMESGGQGGADATYTIPWLLKHPLQIVYLYWNTVMEQGAFLLQGHLGGILSWLDFRMNWIFELIFLICLLLLVNLEGDRYEGGAKSRILAALVCVVSSGFIMMSMLTGYTKMSYDYIQGIQGRYFLPLAPLLVFLTANRMVYVRRNQAGAVWMTMTVTEILLILQLAAMIGQA